MTTYVGVLGRRGASLQFGTPREIYENPSKPLWLASRLGAAAGIQPPCGRALFEGAASGAAVFIGLRPGEKHSARARDARPVFVRVEHLGDQTRAFTWRWTATNIVTLAEVHTPLKPVTVRCRSPAIAECTSTGTARMPEENAPQ